MMGITTKPQLLLPLVLLSAFGVSSCTVNPYQSPLPEAGAGTTSTAATTPVVGGGTGGGGSNVDHSQRGFVVQLIASAYPERAEEIKNQYVREGYSTFVNTIVRHGQTLYRVQIGPYVAEQDAEEVLINMQQRYPHNELVTDAIINENR